MWNLDEIYKTFFESGQWNASGAQYDTDTPAPNVTASSFTLPFPSEDIVFNPNLMKEPVAVDVRSEFSY